MTQTFNHTAHKKMWTWLAEHPFSDKSDYFDFAETIPTNKCYACESTETAGTPSLNCKLCPFRGNWEHTDNVDGHFECEDGLYYKWVDAQMGSKERSELARIIANLPISKHYRGELK